MVGTVLVIFYSNTIIQYQYIVHGKTAYHRLGNTASFRNHINPGYFRYYFHKVWTVFYLGMIEFQEVDFNGIFMLGGIISTRNHYAFGFDCRCF